MSANFGDSSSTEVELNITPIIDCFTVLITFLLASASFLSIGFFEASTPGTSAPADGTPPPDLEAMVKVHPAQKLEITFKGNRSDTIRFDLSTKEGIEVMDRELDALKKSKYSLSQFLISADDGVEYKSMMEVMGYLNKTEIPVIVGDF